MTKPEERTQPQIIQEELRKILHAHKISVYYNEVVALIDQLIAAKISEALERYDMVRRQLP